MVTPGGVHADRDECEQVHVCARRAGTHADDAWCFKAVTRPESTHWCTERRATLTRSLRAKGIQRGSFRLKPSSPDAPPAGGLQATWTRPREDAGLTGWGGQTRGVDLESASQGGAR